ncbi:hypothetical protein MA16_Dca028546 [Dendrobium catenatum]|uniref:Uncharacterized protein n=1 Tax=Dendrobium catenatum TaxID=906689 RepID=A0A2I0V801_9ASPA|nr:hypothetical protein MA16_Dca028546 [Dendrobium catenatum]
MIDAVSQCPRLFQIEGSWRPGTMTSSSSISLRARDFYAGRDSRLCVEKKRQLKQIESLFFFFYSDSNQPLGTKQPVSSSAFKVEEWSLI